MRRNIFLTITMTVLILLAAGCGKGEFKAKTVATLEAESGECLGNAAVAESATASGGSYVEGFKADGDACFVTVDIKKEGFYDLVFTTSSSDGGFKSNYVYVDGVQLGTIDTEGTEYTDQTFTRVYLSVGSHKIGLSKYWGYIRFDRLSVTTSKPLDKDMYKVSAKLCNPNANDDAKRLMSYLTDVYGEYILSGQYAQGGYGSWEVFCMRNENGGKDPAVIGLEMGHCCQNAVNNNFTHNSVEDAIKVWEKGGIVTMCYHWLAPEQYVSGAWYSAFRNGIVDIPLTEIMNGEDEEGMELLLNDIKILAGELQKLEDAGVPVLWRPLHEASGGWFWWGAYGSDTYKKLYILMYDQLTNVYGLDNLIWVWNGQHVDWYPGDEYCDIVGIDIYPGEHEYASHIDSFLRLKSWPGENKIVVLSENGTMPDADAAVRDGAMWGFFCTWEGEFVLSDGLAKKYSETYTEKDVLYRIYNHDKVLTLDELPDLKTYPIKEEQK